MDTVTGLRRAVEELRTDLQVSRGSIQHLTNVLQGEQERASANERIATADRARIEELFVAARDAKGRDDQHLHAIHTARKDLTSLEARMREAFEKLCIHSDTLTTKGSSIAELIASAASAVERLDKLESASGQLHCDVDAANGCAEEHGAELLRLRDVVQNLDALSAEASERTRSLEGAHGETARSLCHTIDAVVSPALERAERERQRLDAADARIAELDSRSAQTVEHATNLHGTSSAMASDLGVLRDRVHELVESVQGLSEGLTAAGRAAKADREWLEDAHRGVERLGEGEREAATALRKVRAEVAETRAATAEQAELGSAVAESLDALRHGLQVTDGELLDLRVYLGVPRGADGE